MIDARPTEGGFAAPRRWHAFSATRTYTYTDRPTDRGGAADGGYFADGHTTASVDAWALGIEKSAVLVGVWEDHGVGVDLEFDSSENYA